jgi:hypothetical protein
MEPIRDDIEIVRKRLDSDRKHWERDHDWGASEHDDALAALDRLVAELEAWKVSDAMRQHPDYERQVEGFTETMLSEAARVPGLVAERDAARDAAATYSDLAAEHKAERDRLLAENEGLRADMLKLLAEAGLTTTTEEE